MSLRASRSRAWCGVRREVGCASNSVMWPRVTTALGRLPLVGPPLRRMHHVHVPRDVHLEREPPVTLRALEALPLAPSTRSGGRNIIQRHDPVPGVCEGTAEPFDNLALLSVNAALRFGEDLTLIGERVER